MEVQLRPGRDKAGLVSDTRGATIMMALVALLIAAMVSAVILAAATSSVKQVTTERDFRQCQLDLQSAGEYAVSEICGDAAAGGRLQVTVTSTASPNEDGSGPVDKWTVASDGVSCSDDSSCYGPLLAKVVSDLYRDKLPAGTVDYRIDSAASPGAAASTEVPQRTVEASLTLSKAAASQGAGAQAHDAGDSGSDNVLVIEFRSTADGQDQSLYLRLKGKLGAERIEEVRDAGAPSTAAPSSYKKTVACTWAFDGFYTDETTGI